ncbi:transglycosylase SLT domain-containing protein [Streptomyces sp. 4N509B]|uniref:transglycosylase SLT domain-containing protein n=1 Tax=Streptomyces sp. 4N509B TaxID=3457413 RepID=UPI003FD1C565
MPIPPALARVRTPRSRRHATAALAAAGVAAIALSAAPIQADAQSSAAATVGEPTSFHVKAADLPGQRQPNGAVPGQGSGEERPGLGPETGVPAPGDGTGRAGEDGAGATRDGAPKREKAEEPGEKAAPEATAEEPPEEPAEESAPAEEPEQPVSRSVAEQPRGTAEQPAEAAYPDTLDGWIRESLDIMAANGIPGTYDGLYRNIIRESSGDPNAINLWDINAQNGTPSIGLLQVIQPTFDAYHVEGTPYDIYDPVANIVAAANYAADRYGSIDNVDGPY